MVRKGKRRRGNVCSAWSAKTSKRMAYKNLWEDGVSSRSAREGVCQLFRVRVLLQPMTLLLHHALFQKIDLRGCQKVPQHLHRPRKPLAGG